MLIIKAPLCVSREAGLGAAARRGPPQSSRSCVFANRGAELCRGAESTNCLYLKEVGGSTGFDKRDFQPVTATACAGAGPPGRAPGFVPVGPGPEEGAANTCLLGGGQGPRTCSRTLRELGSWGLGRCLRGEDPLLLIYSLSKHC